jgi:adenosylcobinamide-phosphate synthase
VLDRVIPFPERAPHPVAAFGSLMGRVEERTYADEVRAGAVYAIVGTAIAGVAGTAVRSTALATWTSLGGRQLHETAHRIGSALETGDLDRARELLPSLVGRDPSALDAGGIARATIESVAENTVDASVAPALWAAVGGARGVLAHRAIDTLDSMVGYRSDRYQHFGTVSAVLDDVVAWVPARVTAAIVLAARPGAWRAILRALRHDAPAHPSPNAGVAEAAFAAALGIQLGGPTDYGGRVEDRPVLGGGRAPVLADIDAAVRLSNEVTTALTAALAAYGLSRPRR